MPGEIDIRSLTAYVISQLADMEVSFGKTKLVKLLYLIDVEFYKLCSRTLTGFDWVFYHYGPYTSTVDQVLKQLDLDIPQEDVITASGHKAIVFKPSRQIDLEFEEQASNLEKSIVDRVLREWGLEELNPILSYVYFHTEPMKDAQRDELLDFSKIVRPPVQIKRRPTEIPIERVKELRNAFHKSKEKRFLIHYESLEPKPRFDEVFWYSLMDLVNDERYSTPKGEINLIDDFKDKVRKQSENE